jgi:hypothetical protein
LAADADDICPRSWVSGKGLLRFGVMHLVL